MISEGKQSSSVRSYISAIKTTIVDDGYQWDDGKLMVRSMARACRVINDVVKTHLPVHRKLLELILFEVNRYFVKEKNQMYLSTAYSTIFALGYYGLMQVGELTKTDNSEKTIKARDIHIAVNKNKILIILYSSKTHSVRAKPQEIKIKAQQDVQGSQKQKFYRNFCPFNLLRDFLHIWGQYDTDDEPFFIFRDGSAITANQARHILKLMLQRISLDYRLYNMQLLCIGRATDIAKFGYSVDAIKHAGHWKSNTVFRYIRC